MRFWHLAQINVARAIGPAHSPEMAGFHAQIPAIDALAEASPGFVWRLQDSAGDATAIQAFDDPYMLVNMSVWESVEALKEFAYRSAHVSVYRDRRQWFEKSTQAHQALWWIPAGHLPGIEEGSARLELLRGSGPTAFAFTFAHPAAEPASPTPAEAGAPQWYNGRRFRVQSNNGNGDVQPGQVFDYRQEGSRVWSEYHSDEARFGSLVAAVDPQGRLDMRYQHLDAAGNRRTGERLSTPKRLPDGRLRLAEAWRWTDGDGSRGESILEETAASSINTGASSAP